MNKDEQKELLREMVITNHDEYNDTGEICCDCGGGFFEIICNENNIDYTDEEQQYCKEVSEEYCCENEYRNTFKKQCDYCGSYLSVKEEEEDENVAN